MTYEEVLSRFQVTKRYSDRAQCICPAHADNKASLTISRKEEKILMHCHAGCDTGSILEAVGLAMNDITNNMQEQSWKKNLEWYMQEKAPNKGKKGYGSGVRITGVYDYRDACGHYLYSKVRFQGGEIEGKEIRYYTIDYVANKAISTKKAEKPNVLYRLPEFIHSVREGYPIYIVEGEKDVETLRKLGYTATSAGGVSDWKKEYAHYFTGAKVVILPDNDEPGLKLKDRIIRDLKYYAHSIRWTITSKVDKGDVTDYLQKEGHSKDDLKRLVEASEAIYAPWLYETGTGEKKTLKVNGGVLADSISRGIPYLIVRRPDEEKDDFYLYEHGVYSKCNRNKVKSIILRYIPSNLASDSLLNNVYGLLMSREDNICSFRELDNDENYINLKNGLYNLKTRQLEPHTPKFYSTIQFECEYRPDDKHKPVFDRYINDLCRDCDGEVDKAKMAILQEYGGLLLSNVKVYRLKCCLVLWSLLGNTGKTQFINLLSELLGEDRTVNIPIQNMNESSKFSLGSIVGKRIISIGDQTSSEIKDSSIFKQLTGGDAIKCEKKGKQPFDYRFTGGIIIACNNLPTFSDDKGGHLFERLCIVPCTNTIEQGRRDGEILDKILKERNAIFNWFLEGLHRLVDNHYILTKAQSCESATREYRGKMDTVFRYLSEFYTVTGNKEDMVSKPDFEADYIRWCNENEYNNVNRQNIKDRMEANGCPVGKANLGDKRGVMVYRNLKPAESDFQTITESEYMQQEFPFS